MHSEPPARESDAKRLLEQAALAWSQAPALRSGSDQDAHHAPPSTQTRNLLIAVVVVILVATVLLRVFFNRTLSRAGVRSQEFAAVAPAPAPAVAPSAATKATPGANQASGARHQLLWVAGRSPALPLPQGAIEVGQIVQGPGAGSRNYVCRAADNVALYPGKLMGGRCNITVNGEFISKVAGFQIATYPGGHWEKGPLAGAAIAGHDSSGDLYLCRAKTTFKVEVHRPPIVRWFSGETGPQPDLTFDSGMQAGKFVPSQNACMVPFRGREVVFTSSYELFYLH